MKLTRRSFLGLTTLCAGAGGLLFSLLGKKPANNHVEKYAETLTLYLDTLIPKEGDFISASDAGVITAFVGKAKADKVYSNLLIKGCQWLETAAQRRYKMLFTSLNELQRIAIITYAENSWFANATKNNLPGYFFKQTREDAYTFYYQHPLTWQALKYYGPPQPNGFLDYAASVNKPNKQV